MQLELFTPAPAVAHVGFAEINVAPGVGRPTAASAIARRPVPRRRVADHDPHWASVWQLTADEWRSADPKMHRNPQRHFDDARMPRG